MRLQVVIYIVLINLLISLVTGKRNLLSQRRNCAIERDY